ncbi:MAG TPA: glycoside hydrolase domain-containing protein [Candidatus Acidoferrales bacterium]|nr:glycoside hydrolase domain-containing protein [Candidatus Acidoferrales bacterium]
MKIAIITATAMLVGTLVAARPKIRPLTRTPVRGVTPAQLEAARTYLGFDRNDYPSDSLLTALHMEFSFAGYWLNDPPGETASTWLGKRSILGAHGFGFLLLFNGRLDKELNSTPGATELGRRDGAEAVSIALREGFPKGATVFLDQEEGGHLLPEQNAYLFAWVDEVSARGFKAGVYCSGIPAPDGPGQFVITANDVKQHEGVRKIAFFVYNDACPPSPGCARSANPPAPSESGVAFASVWQFAQSPRRPEYSAACSSMYAKDRNCYPGQRAGASGLFLDLDSALSPDPSNGK